MATPQETFATLTQELSASGSVPLLDNDDPAKPFTLRSAIGRILWKVNQILPLNGRPRDPKVKDDLFGHVLSLRAEQLITQAILVDLAAKLGVKVDDIRAQVTTGIQS
jgi:hypothetical protein